MKPSKPLSPIRAAGALCWRANKKGRLEVLVIHRPRYNDWSWPKGKADPGETITQTAVRELQEEINATPVLGVPLISISYTTKEGPKTVHYWAAQLTQQPQPDGDEVDELRWVRIDKASSMLSNQADRELATELHQHHQRGRLSTRPLIVLRHAKTVARASWDGPDSERPLTLKGKTQATAAVPLLHAWQPTRLISSPWRRCLATVEPYHQRTGTPLNVLETLSETSHRSHPKRTAAAIATILAENEPTVLCVHRPTLPTIVGTLADHCSGKLSRRLPQSKPYLATAEMLIAHIHGDTIVALEQHRAPKQS